MWKNTQVLSWSSKERRGLGDPWWSFIVTKVGVPFKHKMRTQITTHFYLWPTVAKKKGWHFPIRDVTWLLLQKLWLINQALSWLIQRKQTRRLDSWESTLAPSLVLRIRWQSVSSAFKGVMFCLSAGAQERGEPQIWPWICPLSDSVIEVQLHPQVN